MRVADVANMMARDLGLTPQRCSTMIRDRSKRYIEWLRQHPDVVIDSAGRRNRLEKINAGEGVEKLVAQQWSTIQQIQEAIEASIRDEQTQKLRTLISAMKDAQQNYIQMVEIQTRQEDREQRVIKKDNVEAIIADVFPIIKDAISDQMTSIKQMLPPETRPLFEEAYQSSLDAYTPAINEAIDKLNALL